MGVVTAAEEYRAAFRDGYLAGYEFGLRVAKRAQKIALDATKAGPEGPADEEEAGG